MPDLYIIATPIGNLEDVTLRGLRILKEVDFILCEDTRVTSRLLNRYGIKTPIISYHQHSRVDKIEYIVNLLKNGKNLALVSDAGTPGISDPGNKLIETVASRTKDIVNVITIPGASAVTAAASISGFNTDKFVFFGFPPTKTKREKYFKELMESKYTVIFYESTHRILKALEIIGLIDNMRQVVVCQELTKAFEKIRRGTVKNVIAEIKTDLSVKKSLKGEYTIVVNRK